MNEELECEHPCNVKPTLPMRLLGSEWPSVSDSTSCLDEDRDRLGKGVLGCKGCCKLETEVNAAQMLNEELRKALYKLRGLEHGAECVERVKDLQLHQSEKQPASKKANAHPHAYNSVNGQSEDAADTKIDFWQDLPPSIWQYMNMADHELDQDGTLWSDMERMQKTKRYRENCPAPMARSRSTSGKEKEEHPVFSAPPIKVPDHDLQVSPDRKLHRSKKLFPALRDCGAWRDRAVLLTGDARLNLIHEDSSSIRSSQAIIEEEPTGTRELQTIPAVRIQAHDRPRGRDPEASSDPRTLEEPYNHTTLLSQSSRTTRQHVWSGNKRKSPVREGRMNWW